MPGDQRVEDGLVADEDVILGHIPSRSTAHPLVLGSGARLRSGTVIYAGSEVGSGFETGHHVVVREGTKIGHDVSIWSNTVVDYGCVIGNRVKIHCNCYVAQFTELEDDVFLAPGVTVANDVFPGRSESASAMAGPLIQAGAQIGVNVTILAYVIIGAGAIIGAGSVVTRDIPPGVVAYGSPCGAGQPRGGPARHRGACPRGVQGPDGHLPLVGPTGGGSMARRHHYQGAGPADLIHSGAAKSLATSGTGHVPVGRLNDAAKRAVDVVLASLLLVVLSPLLEIVTIAIRLTSPGPALFHQVRVGYRRSSFVMFKFRTMYMDNDDAEHRAYVTAMLAGQPVPGDGERQIYKLTGDPRVTPIGRFLRRTSLDELPQLINVLRSDMSLVGPRPALLWEAELFEPRYQARFMVKPGITGLWQVSGRNRLTMRQALDLDVDYVRHHSLGLDLVTLLRTIPAVLRSREAG